MDLIDVLMGMSDDQLATLLVLRPDLRHRGARSMNDLATVAARRDSIAECLSRLDRFAQQMTHLMCVAGDGSSAADLLLLVPGLGITEADINSGVDRLVAAAIVVRDGASLRLLGDVRSAIPHPCGLGRSAERLLKTMPVGDLSAIAVQLGMASVKRSKAGIIQDIAARLCDFDAVSVCLKAAPPAALRIIDACVANPRREFPYHLTYGGSYAKSPEAWLGARGMLVRPERWASYMEMPRELALTLRSGRLLPDMVPQRPPLQLTATSGPPPGPSAALRAINAAEVIVSEWDKHPPRSLRSSGLRVQDLRTAAKLSGLGEFDCGRLIEIAAAADLIRLHSNTYVPSARFDRWLGMSFAERWIVLVEAWRACPRAFSLCGLRDARDKAIPALNLQGDAEVYRELRDAFTEALLSAPPGKVIAEASLGPHLEWVAPGLWAGAGVGVGHLLDEARLLGIYAEGQLVNAARALFTAGPGVATATAAAWLPQPCLELTLQADLTATVTGPPDPAMARQLTEMADVESRGVATVYRFSQGSVRRAFDQGKSAADLISFLRSRAPKGLPQPLTYLIEDIGRRHGSLVVGATTSYIRADDPALLAEVLAARGSAKLKLRAVTPTVVVAEAAPDVVVESLRSSGYLPARDDGPPAEAVARAEGMGVPFWRRRSLEAAGPLQEAQRMVARLRGQSAPTIPLRIVPDASEGGQFTADTIGDLLLDACAEDFPVEILYLNPRGDAMVETMQPVDVDETYVYDEYDRGVRIDRILSVRPISQSASR